MSLVFGTDNAFFTLRIESSVFTDGYALVTGGLQDVAGDLDVTAQEVFTSYVETWGPLTWTAAVISECQVINETEVGSYGDPTPGTGPSSNALAVNSALLLEKTGSVRGRRGRGRTFLPAILTESIVFADGAIDGAWLSDAQDAAQEWLTLGGLGTRPHAIAQGEQRPRKDGSPGTPPILPWPGVSTMTVDAKIATQRRRMRR